MPSHAQWPELLEEQAYLVQMLSEVAHDSGALEHTCTLLDMLRADLRVCTMQVADLERENRESSSKHHDSKIASSASKFYHRVTASMSSDKDKDKLELGEDEKHERLLAMWMRKRTLSVEVKNLEGKAQLLRRQNRHYDELQRRLIALYARIPEIKKSSNREDDEAEEEARRAERTLHEVQRTRDRHRTLTALLRHGDYALINAGHHLSAVGSSGVSGADAAKRCVVQTSVVVDQAKRLDPSFFEEEKNAEVLKAGWLGEVFHATSDDSYPLSLLQALKPHHTALLSLISRAHKRTSEHDAAVHRAAYRGSEARVRRDAVMKRVLLMWANAEAESGGEMSLTDQGLEKDVLARMRDITAGLDGVIPIAVPQHSSAAASLSGHSEERQRVVQDGPPLHASHLVHPQPRVPQPTSQLLPPRLTPDFTPTTSSTPSSIPKYISDAHIHAQRGSLDMKQRQLSPVARHSPSSSLTENQSPADPTIRQPSSAVRQPLSPDLTQRPYPSTDPTMGQPASIDSAMRHTQHTPPNSGKPALGFQYERERQSGPGLQNGPSRLSPLQAPSRNSGPDVIPQSQPQPRPGQSLLKPTPLLQQSTKSSQPSASKISSLNADAHSQPPALIQNIMSGTAELRQVPPQSILQSQPPRQPLPQVNAHESYPDSREPRLNKPLPSSNVQIGEVEPQTAGGFSRSASNLPRQTPTSRANLPPQRPVIHGILKQPPVSASRPSAAVNEDPWGVKVAAAASSRPQPKLKTMFNLWRTDGFKHADSDTSHVRVPSQPESQPPSPKKQNPRAMTQVLRFVEAVQIIPRPAVDSDPYEEEEEEELPPSPRRGSMIWLQGEEEDMGESEEDFGGHISDVKLRPDTGASIHTTFAVESQSSISSASSSHSIGQSTHIRSSSSTTPPSSAVSPFSAASISIPSYYTSPDDDWTPPMHQPHRQGGETYDEESMPLGASEGRRQPPSGAGSNPAYTTQQDPRYAHRVIGHTGKEDSISHDDHLADTPSSETHNKGPFMSPLGPNLVPANNPSAPPHVHNPPRQMSYGSVKSEHELLHSIFPSPAQSTVSERDLLFTP